LTQLHEVSLPYLKTVFGSKTWK